MNDLLNDLSHDPRVRKLVKTLGLPVSLPPELERASAAWSEKPLSGVDVVVGEAKSGGIREVLTDAVRKAGAVVRDADTELAKALVFDATGIDTVAGLSALHDFFHPLVPRLAKSGRVVVVGRPPESCPTPEAVAAQTALEGFARSVAKEVGRKGSTAHVVYVEPGAEDRLAGVLRFLLSRRSAFLSGQPFRVTNKAHSLSSPDGWVRALDGKVALVTGAARGIGEATARLLAGEGAHVVVLDRPEDEDAARALARELGGTALLVDITAHDAGDRIKDALGDKGLDIVVHNAGITRDKTLGKMRKEAWNQTVDVNLGAVVRLTRALSESVLRDGGRVICLSSVAGLAGNVGQTNYAASKAGVAGFVRALAPELAPRGITVNAIAPGFIETRMTAAIPFVIREAGRRLSNLSQGGQPADVGEAVSFLASPGAQGLTGQVVRVCGGALIGA